MVSAASEPAENPAENPHELVLRILRETRARVSEHCTLGYQIANEYGCVAELVIEATTKVLDLPGETCREKLDRIRGELGKSDEHSIEYLALIYKYRNLCSHPNAEREEIPRGFALGFYDQLLFALPRLATLATKRGQGERLREELESRRQGNGHLAHTLSAALAACGRNAEIDATLRRFGQTVLGPTLKGERIKALDSSGEKLRAFVLRGLVQFADDELDSPSALGGLGGLTSPGDHLVALARELVRSGLGRPHIEAWLVRHAPLPERSAARIKTLLVTLDRSEGGWVLSDPRLLAPPDARARANLRQWSEKSGGEVTLRSTTEVADRIMEIALGLQPWIRCRELTLLLRVPDRHAFEPFDAWKRSGERSLGGAFRSVVVSPLRDLCDRSTLPGPVERPGPPIGRERIRSVLVSGDVRETVPTLKRLHEFEALFAGNGAAALGEKAQRILQAFEGFPLAVLDHAEKTLDATLETLFETESRRDLEDIFVNVMKLREEHHHVTVLWEDESYETPRAESDA